MIRSIDEAMEALLAYSPADMRGKYQLDRMRALLAYLGNPQESYRTIHIAGTSGKTSTAYFVRGFLEAAEIKTGLTISPHIVAINERVQIGGEPLPEERFLGYLNEFFDLLEGTDLQPTYFELLIALAYRVFAKEGVEYAVVETGLGGLLDATNTIAREDKVCVITNIGLDHTDILGNTLPEIAAQKAGIIQPRNHVLARQQKPEVMKVFMDVARAKRAELELITTKEAPAILPEFQHQNWALARAAYRYVARRDNLPDLDDARCERVAHQTPPGRGEWYEYRDKTIILDGAHNPQKLQALLRSLSQKKIDSAAVLANFVESSDDKLIASVALLAPFASAWIVPEFSAGQDLKSRRSFAATRIVSQAGNSRVRAVPDTMLALEELLGRPEKTLLITGSLYLVSILRPRLLALQSK